MVRMCFPLTDSTRRGGLLWQAAMPDVPLEAERAGRRANPARIWSGWLRY